MRKSIPNFLSLSRIVLAAAFLSAYSARNVSGYLIGIVMIGLGLTTDRLDGVLARRWKCASEVGFLLDGLGDRAFYIAFVLAFVVTHNLHILLAWLIILREVSIYAVRLIGSETWRDISKRYRWVSYLFATFIRLWALSFFIADGLQLRFRVDLYRRSEFIAIQLFLLGGAIVVGYIVLAKNVSVTWRRYLDG